MTTEDWQNWETPEGARTKMEPEERRILLEPKGWRVEAQTEARKSVAKPG